MKKDIDRPPLSRVLRVDEIAEDASGETEATKSEMADIAALLDLTALEGLAFRYEIRQDGNSRLRLNGKLTAEVTQTCVVTLDPVKTSLDVPVEAEFWPVALIEALEQDAEESGNAGRFDWPEPIEEGKIDLGSLIYETLATALDPYPRREGARFEWSQGAGSGSDAGNGPFAALGALKRR